MPIRQLIEQRLTHRFADGWAHEDQWRRVGTFKVLPSRCVREPEAIGDGGTYIVHAIAPFAIRTTAQRNRARQALADTLSGSSCQHEHDCCGCTFVLARVIHSSRRRFVLRMSVSRNC